MRYLFLFFILIALFIAFVPRIENFNTNVDKKYNYGDDYKGFCRADITEKQFATGLYNTECWDKKSIEDCQQLNNNGFSCGTYLPTGRNLPCIHDVAECHTRAMCNNSCYESANNCDRKIFPDINYKKQILSGTLL